MPLTLNTPKEVIIDTIKISEFSVAVEPLSVRIGYVRGRSGADGFEQIDGGSVQFSAEDVLAVDPAGDVYGAIKGALYALLVARIGSGTIS